jgi:hypothetical protein
VNLRSRVDAVRAHFAARVEVSRVEIRFAEHIQQFAKWWFDLIKNIIVVVALKVLADKAHLWYVSALSEISKYILIFYCLSYTQGYYYVPFGSRASGTIRLLTSVISAILVMLLIIWSISGSAILIIEVLSKLQTRQ